MPMREALCRNRWKPRLALPTISAAGTNSSTSAATKMGKYLLAMVLIYFRRAKLRVEEYRQYFFPSLFLANQFEEDLEFQREIYAWTPGWTLKMKRNQLLHLRNQMLIKMDFRAWVEKETCDLIMAQDPDHWAWKRQREDHHSLAIRWFRRDFREFSIRGPWTTLPTCSLCNPIVDSSKEEEAENTHHQTDAEEEPGTSAIIISERLDPGYVKNLIRDA
ncbi:speedy protein 1-A-like [Leptodactylus fuscus]|uniref:speedy protein 1-A-like n=1 Tax=Leptodactylus fuscus TaxID=238119 RepID=UPI003F4EFC4C